MILFYKDLYIFNVFLTKLLNYIGNAMKGNSYTSIVIIVKT